MSISQKSVGEKPLSTLGGALIIAGTSIGGGILGLPVITGQAGFFPSLSILFVSWAFMTITGLLYLELCVLHKKQVNILTMATHSFGTLGRVSTWVMYLFLFYCLTVAYLVGGANFLEDIMYGPTTARVLLFGAVFIVCILLGKVVVDRLNRLLMIGLFLSYIGFVSLGLFLVRSELLFERNWSELFFALPIAFASFGYQGTVPTVARWMRYEQNKIQKAIVLGTTMTLSIYIVWQWLFLGIIPKHGPHGLIHTMQLGRDAVYPLRYVLRNPLICMFARVFGFCTLTTSFIGVGIGLVDFLADGLSITRRRLRDLLFLGSLAFLPPIFCALLYPDVFLEALSLSGGFGGAFLLGALPIAMVYREKFYKNELVCKDSILGKKWVLWLLILFVVFEMFCEAGRLFSR